jgi:hypothetical protein
MNGAANNPLIAIVTGAIAQTEYDLVFTGEQAQVTVVVCPC